jgi:archaellum biogenesis ATPase FlaH
VSRLGQEVLVSLLTDQDSLLLMAKEGIPLECIPTADLRPVVQWALTHFRTTGEAPTPAVMREEHGDVLDDNEIDPGGDVEETIEWAIDDLRADYVRNEAGKFSRELVQRMTECTKAERVDTLGDMASQLSALVTMLQPKTTQVDMRESGAQMLEDYLYRAAHPGEVVGLTLGMPMVDAYTGGIHPGELAIIGGGPKTGKSWFMNFVAYHQWLQGKPTALFTLENSIKMTEMRIACIALHISSTELQTGMLSAEDLARLREWVEDELKNSDTPLHIFSPDGSQRTPQAIVQTARANGAEALIIDQLSYMKAYGDRRLERREEIANILRDLALMIETGRQPLSCLLAHQINREGVKASMATGRLHMNNFADGSEVERVATFAAALFRSEDMVATSAAQLQTLAFRRGPATHFDLLWDIDAGHVMARNEVDLSGL